MESQRDPKKRLTPQAGSKTGASGSSNINNPTDKEAKEVNPREPSKAGSNLSILSNNGSELESFFGSANALNTNLSLDNGSVELDCNYFDCAKFNSSFSYSKDLSFFHLNINSLAKHFDDLDFLLKELNHNFKIIGITETRITNSAPSIHNFEMPGYSFINTETESTAGGTALYIADSVKYKPRQDLSSSFYVPMQIESTFVEVMPNNQPNYIVGCIYKHPSFSINDFNKKYLCPLLEGISREDKKIALLGDFNINLLNNKKPEVNEFVDILSSYLVIPTISLPTRVTLNSQTLIDNILLSPSDVKMKSGNLAISDHLPQFLILESSSKEDPPVETFHRDWKNFDRVNFVGEFSKTNWKGKLQLENKDPNKSFEAFFASITALVDRYVPLKKKSNKKHKAKQKPWITKGIKTSINKRNNLFKRFLKAKDPTSKSHFHFLYKQHRNEVVKMISISKNNHYKTFFNANLKNSKVKLLGKELTN